MWHSLQSVSSPEKTTPLAVSLFFFFFLSHNKQKSEHQSESNSATSWSPTLWKASLHHATPKKKKKHRAISPHQPAPKLFA
jgi:hypothetical protein